MTARMKAAAELMALGSERLDGIALEAKQKALMQDAATTLRGLEDRVMSAMSALQLANDEAYGEMPESALIRRYLIRGIAEAMLAVELIDEGVPHEQ